MSRLDSIEGSFFKAFRYAWSGIAYTYKTQMNFKIHLAAAAAAVFLGFLLSISLLEWALIAIVIGNVLIFEVLNTSIEKLVDLIEERYNFNAKVAKDAAAGMVLISAATAVCVGGIVFIPKIF